jgi:hypothetical protein
MAANEERRKLTMLMIRYILMFLSLSLLSGLTQSGCEAAEQKKPLRNQDMQLETEAPTLETFWRESEDDHWALNGEAKARATSELIHEAEAKFGIRLPALIKALYERRKGGYTDFTFYPGTADEDWRNVVGGQIPPPNRLETLSELADMTDFDDEELDYRNRFDDADRVIVLSRHGWDTFLCLDYRMRGAEAEPEVVYFEEGADGLEEVFRVPDFATFFSRLRRERGN